MSELVCATLPKALSLTVNAKFNSLEMSTTDSHFDVKTEFKTFENQGKKRIGDEEG